ncbi:MAG: AAA family ATPase [Isosphaeraceae bacterium]
MKGMIRVILVDPNEESRQTLERMLGGMDSVWLVGACPSYAAAAKAVDEMAPDLTLVVLDTDAEQAVGLIQELLRARPDSAVLPASRPCRPDLILRLMRAGAREFLMMPTGPDELLATIDRLVPADAEGTESVRRGARVIAVTGAAGGVGSTTIAVNLATILAKQPEQSVVLVDFDLVLGSVDACLDIIPDRTLLDVAQSVDRLDLTLLKRSMTRHSSGLYVLPRPVALEDAAKVDPEALKRVIGLLKAAFSVVIIDTSKGLQASDLVAFEMADTILMVVQLDLTCLRNTTRLLNLFRQFDGLIDRVKVVVNRAGSREYEISLKKAEETLNLKALWQIADAPRDFASARSRGVSLEVQAPGGKAHRALLKIAQSFSTSNQPETPRSKWRIRRFAAMSL